MISNGFLDVQLESVGNLSATNWDGIIYVAPPNQTGDLEVFSSVLDLFIKLDAGLKNDTAVIPLTNESGAQRLVYSPTGPIDLDYDDVRVFRKAAVKGIKRAIKAGVENPIVVLAEFPKFKNSQLVTLLGYLEALYVPIQIREHDLLKIHKIKRLGVYTKNATITEDLIKTAQILESGRRVACDIGGGDPERMAPPKVEEYIQNLFSNSAITLNVVKNVEEIKRDYPLFEAVNRAASAIERHQGRIIFLDYTPSGNIEKTLFLVGKGITYDTGGADIKAGGAMAGMSRDKCGAAAVAGFFQIVRLLQPKNIRIIGGLAMARNSVGSNSYVADELIKARSGALIRVVNTDAEGRMVMADVLCKFKEMALTAKNPHLYTVATLTGHACLSVGLGYSIVLDNGPARNSKHAQNLQSKGEEISEPFEISPLRRDDFNFHKGLALGDDVTQANNEPSTRTSRGHQGPAAFLILASGLKDHGTASACPLKYSHLDIAASSGRFPDPATGAPVLALANLYMF